MPDNAAAPQAPTQAPPRPQPQLSFGQQFIYFAAIILILVALMGLGVYAVQAYEIKPADNSVLGFLALTAIILAFAGAILWKIISGKIELYGIIAEPAMRDEAGNLLRDKHGDLIYSGKASLARFQFLLFTFVVAGLFLMLSIESGTFVNIPTSVLGLMGISGGSFLVSKAMGGNVEDGQNGGGQGGNPPPNNAGGNS